MSGGFVRGQITIMLPTMSTIRLTGRGSGGNNGRGSTLGGGFKDNKGISLANRPSSPSEKRPGQLPLRNPFDPDGGDREKGEARGFFGVRWFP